MATATLSQDAIRVLRQIQQRGLLVHFYHYNARGFYEDGDPENIEYNERMSDADVAIVLGELTRHWDRVRAFMSGSRSTSDDPGYLDVVNIHEDDDWYDSMEQGIWNRYALTDKALHALASAELEPHGTPTSGAI